ncbi:flavin-dependent dehydrogenase [Frankia torreyi]|uniref:Flavin-dependent dehydrogenase n=3 Tax=Frankia TaxID=1854 RepID=A0A0D8BM91_9ACTN|nr:MULTISPECIES: FAD-dependent monooxygenase [Frankia]KJE25129.1 flavin-dependent dehydrogenase [Frankia torreyi]
MPEVGRYDVAVVGGGPAGAATALTLARAGRRVLLLAAPAGRHGPQPAGRHGSGETLPPVGRTILRDLGLWTTFQAEGHLPCPGTNAAWGSAGLQGVDHVFDPHGHGWHLDRASFDSMMRDHAARAGADVRTAVVRHLARTAGGWRIRPDRPAADDDGVTQGAAAPEPSAEVAASWLVDATGRRALLARSRAVRHRYDRLIATSILLEPVPGDTDARTLVEARPGGWWYTSLVTTGQRAVAFFTDVDLVPPALQTAGGFLAAAQHTHHLRHRADPDRAATSPRLSPAAGRYLDPPIGAAWLAVGDAALAVDPLSSQGILNALHSGFRAGLTIAEDLAGNSRALQAYRSFIDRVTATYLRNSTEVYRQERRWTESTFWRRRHDVA